MNTQTALDNSTFRNTCRRAAWCLLVGLLSLSPLGCRQPVTSPTTSQSPFGRLFGGSQYAQSTPAGYAGFNQNFAGNNQYGLGGNSPGQLGNLPGTGAPTVDPQTLNQFAGQYQNLQQRLTAYDTDNQLLNTELASMKQRLELANQYSQQLKQQLADTASQIQQSEQEKQIALQQLAAVRTEVERLSQSAGSGQLAGYSGQVPTQLTGATIRANNGLMQRLNQIQIPGGQARMDGDVIRIEFPSDNLFVPGSYELQPAQLPALQSVVATIRQNFPQQIVGIESHWDSTPLNPSTISHHQYTATQALAIFDRLVSLGMPRQQMFTMAMGSNRPRHARQVEGGIHPNRRIELVIYPETWDGSE